MKKNVHKNSRKWHSCETKVRYKTEAAAEKRAKVVRTFVLGPYHCPFCNRWHIGHHPTRAKKRHRGAK